MRPIDADRLLTDRMKEHYYHLPNGDIAIPIIDIEHAPTITPERKRRRWIEKKVARPTNYGCIAEWQSCKCSECGRYDTRPYMYYFDEPNFCSWCGASMQEDES